MKWIIGTLVLIPLNLVFSQIKLPSHSQVTFQHDQKDKKQKFKNLDTKTTLPDRYLNQVINRKKNLMKECADKRDTPFQDILIELTIQPTGQTKSRLINTQQKNKSVLHCSIGILNRIQFKKFSGPPIVKSYLFSNKGY